MFQINSYLQYKNTPDGKPRVLKKSVDYNIMHDTFLFDSILVEALAQEGDANRFTISNVKAIANLSDCRPLLTVEIDGVEWTEGDIITEDGEDADDRTYTSFFVAECGHGGLGLTKYNSYSGLDFYSGLEIDKDYFKNLGSFFDDPAKYSKLLWDCSEEEGWDKIFKLLEISK